MSTSSVTSVTSVPVTSVSTTILVSLTTSLSTVTQTSTTSTITSVSTSSSTIVTSITSLSPSTTYVPAPGTTTPTSVEEVTSTITTIPTNQGGSTLPPEIVTITSYRTPTPSTNSLTSSGSTSSSASASATALTPNDSSTSGGGGLSTGATIAIAVIIPIVVLAALFFLGLFFWRRRKAKKQNEELVKDEIASYGYNPNSDPAIPPVVAAAAYADDGSDDAEEKSGYRGWGTTNSNRKASTTLGSNGRPNGMSDGGSQPGGYQYQTSPPRGAGPEAYQPEALAMGHPEGYDGVGALGGAAAVGAVAGGVARHRSTNNDMRRGPSNASSAYSAGRPVSDASSETPAMAGQYGQYYTHDEVPYNVYTDAQADSPYGDLSHDPNAGQPVIKDVSARRNPQLSRVPTFPQTQGGIAQNF